MMQMSQVLEYAHKTSRPQTRHLAEAITNRIAHLLKTAELKLAKPTLRPVGINVVLKNDKAAERRFRQMFGSAITRVSQSGLDGYVRRGLGKFLA
jgi:hypothetical protein